MAYPRGKPAPNRGIPHSQKTKEKISKSCKKVGMGKWNIGSTHTEEQIRKQRISIKKYYQNNEVWNKGIPHSEETKERVSLGLKRYWTKKNWND